MRPTKYSITFLGNVHDASMPKDRKSQSRYGSLIQEVFFSHWETGCTQFEFTREELETAAVNQNIKLPKNLGDITYSFRFRTSLPAEIITTQPDGLEWIIEGAGKSKYRFRLCKNTRIFPNENLEPITIPGATPEFVRAHSLSDEQALLTIVRYNRLIDIFLGLTTYSLQNHLRTAIEGVGQIEVDEIYVGINRKGQQFVIPVQAKAGYDQIGVVQPAQDIEFSKQRYPNMICRSVSAQFMRNGVIALLELGVEDGEIKVLEEEHYRLVSAEHFH